MILENEVLPDRALQASFLCFVFRFSYRRAARPPFCTGSLCDPDQRLASVCMSVCSELKALLPAASGCNLFCFSVNHQFIEFHHMFGLSRVLVSDLFLLSLCTRVSESVISLLLSGDRFGTIRVSEPVRSSSGIRRRVGQETCAMCNPVCSACISNNQAG